MSAKVPIRVYRAPVLTLWATIVAERLGYPPDIALTLGHFVAGSSARAKARSLGIADDAQEATQPRERAAAAKAAAPSSAAPRARCAGPAAGRWDVASR